MMASSAAPSLRTLARPSILPSTSRLILPPISPAPPPRATARAAPLSTSALSLAAAAPSPAVKSRRDLPKKTKKTFKKKTNVVAVKKPAPGERMAFRKRIQLSNNSALPVEGIEEMTAGALADPASSGRMMAVPDRVVDQLRALEAFKTTQTWALFRRPHFLVRDETVELVGRMAGGVEKREALRCVIRGSKLSGKSLALLQGMAYGLMNEWVVLHVPEGQDLTNGNTEYAPVENTSPTQFTQPVYTLKLLQNTHKANKALLEKLPLQQDWTRLGSHLQQGAATLADLVLSAKESEYAWPTLSALWSELGQPGRPPVLLAVDGLAHLNRMSEYRDASFRRVHAHELSLVRLFTDALSGKTPLPNGGAILAATSDNNTYYHPSQELVLSQLEAGQAGGEIPRPDPYERGYDDRVYDVLKNCHVLRVGGLSRAEARVLMEYWGASGLLRSVLDSRTVAERWALGGHGIVGEMERVALMTMRM